MRIGQIRQEGRTVAAVFEDGMARPIPGHTVADLIRRSEVESTSLAALAESLASRHPEPATPLAPIHPVEVWACGCTYETSASFRDAEHGTREGMYAYVYRGARPLPPRTRVSARFRSETWRRRETAGRRSLRGRCRGSGVQRM